MRAHVDYAASVKLIQNFWRLRRVAERQVELPNSAVLILREPDRVILGRHDHGRKGSIWNFQAVHRIELERQVSSPSPNQVEYEFEFDSETDSEDEYELWISI